MGPYQADRFFEGLAGDQEEADALVAGLDDHLVAAIGTRTSDRLSAVAEGGGGSRASSTDLRGHGEGLAGIAEFARTREDVGEGVAGWSRRAEFSLWPGEATETST